MSEEIDEIFKGIPNILGIAGDILIVGSDADGLNHDRTLRQVMQKCPWENLKIK